MINNHKILNIRKILNNPKRIRGKIIAQPSKVQMYNTSKHEKNSIHIGMHE